MAREAIHSARKAKSASMIIKLDILKAYNQIDRQILKDILKKFGFEQKDSMDEELHRYPQVFNAS